MHILRCNTSQLRFASNNYSVTSSIKNHADRSSCDACLVKCPRSSGLEDGICILLGCLACVGHELTLLAADGDGRYISAAQGRHSHACRARCKANAAQSSGQSGDWITRKASTAVLAAGRLVGAHVTHQNHRTRHVMQQVGSEMTSSSTTDDCAEHTTHALRRKIITDDDERSVHLFSYATNNLTGLATSRS